MDVGIAGSGPAAESLRAALADVDAATVEVAPDDLGRYPVGAVVAPAGSDAFAVADERATRWVAVEVGGLGGRVVADLDAAVSVFDPDSGGHADLRVRAASTDTGTDGRPSGDRSAVRFAGALAGRRLVALLSGGDVAGTVVEVTGAGVGPTRRFSPVPRPESRDRSLRRDDGGDVPLEDALGRAERAVDERVGLLTQVGERESWPVPYYVAGTADTTAFSDARAAEFAGGADADWNAAYMKALGEGLERYCAGVYRASEFVTAPETNRANPVPVRAFVRPEGYETPGREEPMQWVEGVDLATGDEASLPAEFVHYPPPTERFKPPITTGLGLGNSGTEALLSGLYEVLERDATMLAWYSTFEPLGLDVDDEGYEELLGRARAERLDATALLVTQDVDVPVVAVAVHREGEWPRFAMGSGADLDAAAAARSALAEAIQNWTELNLMGPEQASQEQGAIGRYADFPASARRFVDADATVPAASVGPETVPGGEAELDAVVDRVTDAGLEPYAARVTTTDVERLGFEAVRVLVPAAQPLFTGDPYFGERARTVPGELGFESDVDREYHPYP
jgi:ribosomal protein S12 methylthiotransferase accessory factor